MKYCFTVVFLVFNFLLLNQFLSAEIKPVTDLKPTVILVSIDGFRADYLTQYKPKNLNKLAHEGVRAKWLIPSFPTKTYPNHYTIATGLLPEHHGIIENNIYDPEFDSVFGLNNREEVQNPRWWLGEPIWVTAARQDQIAASYFFPGTETKIKGVQPQYWKNYDGDIPNKQRVETVLSWLDLPVEVRPTMITMYFSDVDDAGHNFSPFSKETAEAVKTIDSEIGRLYKGLRRRKINERVNLIIVSDHGMAAVDPKNVVILDEMFDTNSAKQIFWVGEITQIFPNEGKEDEIYNAIKSNLPPQVRIYRKAEIPERYNYRKNRRIAPLIVLPDEGWRISRREEFDVLKKTGDLDNLKGSHGYDNELESMRAVFIGHGEAFQKGLVAEPFKNIEIYNLMCRILNLEPSQNDGDFSRVSGLLK